MVTPVLRNLTCRKCEGNIGETVGQEVKLCDEVNSRIMVTGRVLVEDVRLL